ncbi:MAG: hypothetical protein JST85_19630 [Acidobacteria bacterium]|nr:hypothetical protein [Acidobacteriota bacterium]
MGDGTWLIGDRENIATLTSKRCACFSPIVMVRIWVFQLHLPGFSVIHVPDCRKLRKKPTLVAVEKFAGVAKMSNRKICQAVCLDRVIFSF